MNHPERSHELSPLETKLRELGERLLSFSALLADVSEGLLAEDPRWAEDVERDLLTGIESATHTSFVHMRMTREPGDEGIHIMHTKYAPKESGGTVVSDFEHVRYEFAGAECGRATFTPADGRQISVLFQDSEIAIEQVSAKTVHADAAMRVSLVIQKARAELEELDISDAFADTGEDEEAVPSLSATSSHPMPEIGSELEAFASLIQRAYTMLCAADKRNGESADHES